MSRSVSRPGQCASWKDHVFGIRAEKGDGPTHLIWHLRCAPTLGKLNIPDHFWPELYLAAIYGQLGRQVDQI